MPGIVITSRQFWLIYTGFQSRPAIRFKVALQTYKTLTTKKPEYLADLLSFQTASRSLRSSSMNRLHVDVARTSFASQAFRHLAPSVWNALPVHLTDVSKSLNSFKKQLKTFLYSQAYHSLTVLLVRACDSIYSYFNMFSLTYGTSPAVYYYYLLLIQFNTDICMRQLINYHVGAHDEQK